MWKPYSTAGTAMWMSFPAWEPVAVVEGVERLSGAPVECTDLRGGAALVIAALAAEGETEIGELRHLDRGYEGLEAGLSGLGAAICRIGG